MVKNYLKIALRNLWKYKEYSLINISGLAIGMAVCILIFLWVQDELSFDRLHENCDNLFRVVTEGHYTEQVIRFSETPAQLGQVMKDEFPEIVNAARLGNTGRVLVRYKDNIFYENQIYFADPSIFEMFTFPFIEGDPEKALTEPYLVIITEEIAKKYFGEDDPMGKQLNFDNQLNVQISGIIKKIPHNSSLQFDFILPFELLIKLGGPTHWGGHFYQTYIQLQSNVSFKHLNEKLPDWTKNHTNEPVRYYLQPMIRIHLYELSGGGAIVYVYIFSAIALFVLLVACINFMNLSTARSMNRTVEVGLRKVIGACRSHIIKQFFGESIFLTIIALLFALILVSLFLPTFNFFSGKELTIKDSINTFTVFGLFSITLLTGIISGSYPSLFLSSFQPVKVIKGMVKSGKSGTRFRKILVVVQFTLSIILIIGTAVIYKQMNYIRNKNLGFDKELMVCLPIRGNMGQNYEAIKAEILQNPNITGVTAGSGMPAGPIGSEWGQIDWEGKDPEAVIPMRHIAVDYDYLEVFGMKIVQGRNFSKEFSTDTVNFILNEAAVKATGLDSPIGKRFYLLFRNGTIVGIVKNFHLFSLRREINPVIIRMVPHRFWRYIFVRLNPNQHDMFTTMNFLENIWKNYMPDYPFEYEFLDDRIDQLYRTEQRISTIFRYFTFLTMFVACMGLFGLASCTAEQRTKEIGIRKVLGARITVIVLLLTKEFTKLILFANLIAWPVAYYAMNKWLQNFAYRTNIGWLTFILSGMLVLVIALITVSYQSIKAAVANPVESLRYE